MRRKGKKKYDEIVDIRIQARKKKNSWNVTHLNGNVVTSTKN